MKAIRYHSTGGPEVLSLDEVPEPALGKGEVCIRVLICGVNCIDIWARSGRYKTPLPHILGADIAGEVVSVGPEAGEKVGSKVVVYPMISDGTCTYCRRGLSNLCVSRGFIGVATDGGYAEMVRVPAANLIPAGDLDARDAAALPVNYGTAWSALVNRARVSPGDSVLVWGAAGGLGHAAVQVAKHLGAQVIAVVGDGRKEGFVRSQGADHVVLSGSDDLAGEVRALTAGLGASVVFDHVGGDTWSKSIECLARGGKMITLGLTSGPRSEIDVRRVYADELSIIGTYGQTRGDLRTVVGLAAEGKLKPSIYEELPLESARKAHEILESREVQGKVILRP